MRCLVSSDKTQLDNIIAQIDALCGWPDGFTQTATTIQWSDRLQTFWCSIEDARILNVIGQIDLGLLMITDYPAGYFEDIISLP